MKHSIIFILIVFIFLASFLYLHQKVLIFVEAYKLSKNHRIYNELVDKRDYLVYNFTKETSVLKVNQWAEKNKFIPAEKVLALNLKRVPAQKSQNKLASLVNGLLGIGIPTGSATALAKEGQ